MKIITNHKEFIRIHNSIKKKKKKRRNRKRKERKIFYFSKIKTSNKSLKYFNHIDVPKRKTRKIFNPLDFSFYSSVSRLARCRNSN